MAKLSWPSQSILKEINPEYSLEGLMLKLQYFGHLMQKTMKKMGKKMNRLIVKETDAGKDWGQEEKGTTEDEMIGWHHLLSGHECKQSLGDR